MKKIMVGMSGGVDSSVAALLLKEQGHEVVGVTMCLGITYEENLSPKQCCSPESINDAKRVCDAINIPHYVFDYAEFLKRDVIDNFISEYQLGRTPNPCVRCNQFLKFSHLMQKALSLGFDYIATGHYARILHDSAFHLSCADDKLKDQTYFLWGIEKESLSRIIFPVSHLKKSELREIARDNSLPVANKTESQDICFVPDGNYKNLMKSFGMEFSPGNIVDTQGLVLGKHKGIENYTIGQRRGIGVALGSARYVVDINTKENKVIIGTKEDLEIKTVKIINTNLLEMLRDKEYKVKIRSNMKAVSCMASEDENSIIISFREPQYGVSLGQSAVLYDNDIVVAGGIIDDRSR